MGGSGTRHVPMQAQVGDYAVFLRKASVEIKFEGRTYLIVPQAAILLLDRHPARRPRPPRVDRDYDDGLDDDIDEELDL